MCTFCYFRSEKSERVRTGVIEDINEVGIVQVQVNDFPSRQVTAACCEVGKLVCIHD